MALLRCDFFSDVLGLSTSMSVVLPQPTSTRIGMGGVTGEAPPPVLYLLHGLSDDDTTWVRRTSIERYVAPLGLAVVMPAVHRSFYLDGVHTGDYWTFLTDELPALVGRFLRVSDRPEDTYVAGLSMGGYGAMRWALRRPDRIAAAASLSGALTVDGRPSTSPHPRLWRAITGGSGADPAAVGPAVDLLADLDAVDPAVAPPLYLACGTEDELLPMSERFRVAATGRGLDVTWRPSPGGHDWAYWDRAVRDVLTWLPRRRPSDTGVVARA